MGGRIFDFAVTPSPKKAAFAQWDAPPTVKLLADPFTPAPATPRREEVPRQWTAFLEKHPSGIVGRWALHDAGSAYRVPLEDGEYLVLAECEGDQFVLLRTEPPAESLFYLSNHDGTPEPLDRDVEAVIRGSD